MSSPKSKLAVLAVAISTCAAACGTPDSDGEEVEEMVELPTPSSSNSSPQVPAPFAPPSATGPDSMFPPSATGPGPMLPPAPSVDGGSPSPVSPPPSPAPTPGDGPLPCDANQTACAGACVDTDSSPAHCGACNQSCPSGSNCVQGACICQGELADCDGACVDLQTDGKHCGSCAQACDATEVCTQGECASGGCMPGATQCGPSCVDTSSNNSHCGSCSQPCPAGQLCDAGVCACPEEATLCDGQCVDTATSADHCGICDNACPQEQSCNDGACEGSAAPTSDYPCDGSTDGYDAVVTISGNNARTTIQNALNGLTANRDTKQSVLVQGDGSMGNNERIELPSYTILNLCGTLTVDNANGSGDQSPFYARNRTQIEIPNATIRGVPLYAMFFREVSNLHLGKIDIRLSGQGFGIRIDNAPGEANNWGRSNQVTNIRLDDIYVEGTSNHGVETYGVDGLTIGTVVARDTGYAGVLLNATINAEVGLVDAEDVATGSGYAAFRIANEAGKTGGSWPAGNIHVGEVRALRGGRGIFCVSDSGGLTIDRLTLQDNGNNSILLENCHSVQIATDSGTVTGGGEVRISQRADEHTPSSNISLGNLTITGTQLNENPCANNTVICNVQGTVNACGDTQQQCPW